MVDEGLYRDNGLFVQLDLKRTKGHWKNSNSTVKVKPKLQANINQWLAEFSPSAILQWQGHIHSKPVLDLFGCAYVLQPYVIKNFGDYIKVGGRVAL